MQWTIDLPLVVERHPDVTILEYQDAGWAVDQSQVAKRRITQFFGERWQGCSKYAYVDRPSFPSTTAFIPTVGPSLASAFTLPGSHMVDPLGMVLLGGLSPLDLYGVKAKLLPWPGVGNAMLALTNYGDPPDYQVVNRMFHNEWDWTIEFDRKTLLPKYAVAYQANVWVSRWKTLESVEVGGLVYPRKILYESTDGHFKDPVKTTRIFTLEKVEPSAPRSGLPIVEGAYISDLRLDASAGDLLDADFPPRNAVEVTYRWSGRLPSLEELKAMRKSPTPNFPWSRLLAFGPPLILVVGGSIWLWVRRARRGRVA
ncbi:MAG: hypothetical protein HYR64_02550 [Fimbriimonas ginsengisoli]|uniref:Uncharacterized protein n=1 Tax=Fimbriimonas ginsengisoli TaxID=1005039 RepID=A0A931PT45_FIMGI|nr:hypothetical protein [Fimbriimonas ginsengisoli]